MKIDGTKVLIDIIIFTFNYKGQAFLDISEMQLISCR